MTDIWRLLKKHQMFNLLTLSAAVHCCLQIRQVFSFFTLAGSVAFASQIVPQPFQSSWTADGLGKRNCQQSKVNISGEAKFYDIFRCWSGGGWASKSWGASLAPGLNCGRHCLPQPQPALPILLLIYKWRNWQKSELLLGHLVDAYFAFWTARQQTILIALLISWLGDTVQYPWGSFWECFPQTTSLKVRQCYIEISAADHSVVGNWVVTGRGTGFYHHLPPSLTDDRPKLGSCPSTSDISDFFNLLTWWVGQLFRSCFKAHIFVQMCCGHVFCWFWLEPHPCTWNPLIFGDFVFLWADRPLNV